MNLSSFLVIHIYTCNLISHPFPFWKPLKLTLLHNYNNKTRGFSKQEPDMEQQKSFKDKTKNDVPHNYTKQNDIRYHLQLQKDQTVWTF